MEKEMKQAANLRAAAILDQIAEKEGISPDAVRRSILDAVAVSEMNTVPLSPESLVLYLIGKLL